MHITTLRLKNFRNIEEQAFQLHPQFTVLIGMNGRGKSTLLHALRVACGALFLDIPEVKGRHISQDEVRYQASKDSVSFIRHYPATVEATGMLPGTAETVTWRRIYSDKGHYAEQQQDEGGIRTYARSKYDLLRQAERDDLNLPAVAFFGTSRIRGQASRPNQPRIGREIFFHGYFSWDDMDAASYLYPSWLTTYDILLKNGQEYPETRHAFEQAIRTANPYIRDLVFAGGELWLDVEMEGYQSGLLPLRLHSDGVIAFTELAAELAYRCIMLNGYKRDQAVTETQGLIMIDELDLHLHPNWQRHVVADLKRAFPRIQFVATTHSPFIIQSLRAEELISLDQPFNALDADPWRKSIEDIAADEMQVREVQRSRRFQEMQQAAAEYFSLIEEGTAHGDLEQAKQRLDTLRTLYNDDPAYVALLQAELPKR